MSNLEKEFLMSESVFLCKQFWNCNKSKVESNWLADIEGMVKENMKHKNDRDKKVLEIFHIKNNVAKFCNF